jgi:hypothetical protein
LDVVVQLKAGMPSTRLAETDHTPRIAPSARPMRRARALLLVGAVVLFALVHGVVRPLLLSDDAPSTLSQRRAPPVARATAPLAQRLPPTPSPPPPPPSPSASSCARVRVDRRLVYAAHSGFGNQELSLRRALLVSYVLNRTLVLPPVLHQSDLAFGVPEVRCRDAGWPRVLQRRAEALYASKVTAENYESLRGAYDFGEVEALGMRLDDFIALPADVRASFDAAPLAPLGCTKGERYTAHALRTALHSLRDTATLRVGSTYFLKADLLALRAADPCFDALSRAVLRLPPSAAVRTVVDAALRRLRPPFAAVHLRLADGGLTATTATSDDAAADASSAAQRSSAQRQLDREVRWLGTRLATRVPAGCCALYVATNAPDGVRSPLLASLCAGGSRAYNCSDLSTLGATRLPEWRELLRGATLSPGTAALLVDQAIGAAAGRGFFSTSKFCGPAGFRKSTFSESIALRWQQGHSTGAPLCAHAMERSLLLGKTAHGEHVY